MADLRRFPVPAAKDILATAFVACGAFASVGETVIASVERGLLFCVGVNANPTSGTNAWQSRCRTRTRRAKPGSALLRGGHM